MVLLMLAVCGSWAQQAPGAELQHQLEPDGSTLLTRANPWDVPTRFRPVRLHPGADGLPRPPQRRPLITAGVLGCAALLGVLATPYIVFVGMDLDHP